MQLWKSLAVGLIALGLSGCGTLYNVGVEELRTNPKARADAIADCTKNIQSDLADLSLEQRRYIAREVGVSTARLPQTMCRRMFAAMLDGRLTYADLNDGTSEKVIRVIEGK